ncbi:hypothetical protein [Pseudomonas chlororaphis]|nr:hypothetical protein [Pseudomonas chlororaphis]
MHQSWEDRQQAIQALEVRDKYQASVNVSKAFPLSMSLQDW